MGDGIFRSDKTGYREGNHLIGCQYLQSSSTDLRRPGAAEQKGTMENPVQWPHKCAWFHTYVAVEYYPHTLNT